MVKKDKKVFTKDNIKDLSRNEGTALLSRIPDKPKKLSVCGNSDLLFDPNLKFLCVIGSRRHTQYGVEACEKLISSLSGYPVVIVSGLALGIDGLAHEAALRAGLPCIAVPGSGLDPDYIYPRSHTYLAEQIVEKGGLLLSEYEPQTRASPWSFPMRNRIMAGLSHAILIIEGEHDSGTLITARLGLEYDRDVFAVPGSIFSPSSEGPLSLIKNGAIPICNSDDLLIALGFKEPTMIKDEGRAVDALKNCSNEEKQVLNLLDSPRTREELLEVLPFTVSKLQVILSMLEIRRLTFENIGKIHKVYTQN